MKKDTNNSIEVLARLMEQLYKNWGALPFSICLMMDSTSRECTNQLMVKFGIKIVALDLVESICLNYPVKGSHPWPLGLPFRANVH